CVDAQPVALQAVRRCVVTLVNLDVNAVSFQPLRQAQTACSRTNDAHAKLTARIHVAIGTLAQELPLTTPPCKWCSETRAAEICSRRGPPGFQFQEPQNTSILSSSTLCRRGRTMRPLTITPCG